MADTDLPKTAPMPGIPRIRHTDAEGHVYEGYYLFRVKRQLCPLGHDKLRPED